MHEDDRGRFCLCEVVFQPVELGLVGETSAGRRHWTPIRVVVVYQATVRGPHEIPVHDDKMEAALIKRIIWLFHSPELHDRGFVADIHVVITQDMIFGARVSAPFFEYPVRTFGAAEVAVLNDEIRGIGHDGIHEAFEAGFFILAELQVVEVGDDAEEEGFGFFFWAFGNGEGGAERYRPAS